MSHAEMIEKLDELHAAGKFFGLTIWPTRDGYQVNLATTSKNNWRVRRADTPSEGLALVLGMDFMDDDEPRTPAELLGDTEIVEPREFEDAAIENAEAEAGIFD